MARSLKSVRHLLIDKPMLKTLAAEISAQRVLLDRVRRLLPGELAPHCIAARIDGQRLVVHTDSPVWASRLRFMSAELRMLLENDFPALREVKIRLLPPIGVRPRTEQTAQFSDIAAGTVQSAAEGIADPQLQAALQRLGSRLKPRNR